VCRCHVFVVNERTFPYHLKYLFAGTTAGKDKTGEDKDKDLSLLADICRVRKGDKVVFYLEKVGFFGIFEVDSDYPIYEPPTGYLQEELGVPLIYRVRVRPTQVFAQPISEWEAIDKLPEKSREIRWSLLYRKLTGKRGCSYLFPNESASLIELIRERNNNETINAESQECYTYDSTKRLITVESGQYQRPSSIFPPSPTDALTTAHTPTLSNTPPPRTTRHNNATTDDNPTTTQNCAPPTNDAATPQNPAPHETHSPTLHKTPPTTTPTNPPCHTPHPRSLSAPTDTDATQTPTPHAPHARPTHPQATPTPQAHCLASPPRCAACALSLSCPRHTRVPPLCGGRYALTVHR
jgi:hypothetical protein